MREVEEFRWRVPPTGRRRGYVSTVHLTREEALQQYGGVAQPDLTTMRMRQVPETPEELARRGHRQSAGRDGAK